MRAPAGNSFTWHPNTVFELTYRTNIVGCNVTIYNVSGEEISPDNNENEHLIDRFDVVENCSSSITAATTTIIMGILIVDDTRISFSAECGSDDIMINTYCEFLLMRTYNDACIKRK